MTRRILCLWLPNWPIQRLLGGPSRAHQSRVHQRSAMHQQRERTPLLLHARDPRRGELITACNNAAEQCGVRLGMPLAEATALAGVKNDGTRSVPTTLPHDSAADQAALAQLAEHCERFSPLVGWRTADSSEFKVPSSKLSDLTRNSELGTGNLFLDVTGIGVLFGGEEALAGEVIAEMSRLGYEVRVAIADTVGAAWAGTRQGSEFRVSSSKLVDRDSAATLNSELGTLNLDLLRLPPETLDLLSQLGVTQLDQLLALPRESLRARFGERLLLRVDQFFGAAQETIVAHRPPPQFAAEWVLEYPAERQDVIEQILQQLVQRVARDLAARREGVVQLTCRLDCQHSSPHAPREDRISRSEMATAGPLLLEVGLFRPSAEAEHLWDLLRMQLEQAALPGPVGRITLAARLTAPLENRQGELFAGGEHEAERQLALLIDRCRSRLGADAVLQAELTAEALPERAFKVQSSRFKVGKGIGGRRSGVGRKSRSRSSSDSRSPTPDSLSSPLHRPLALYSPPLPLEVLSVAPDGPPVAFHLSAQRHSVIDKQGPERIETGWWRGRSIRRDYWRVETTSGQRFWLFRSLHDGKWHLHGEFS